MPPRPVTVPSQHGHQASHRPSKTRLAGGRRRGVQLGAKLVSSGVPQPLQDGHGLPPGGAGGGGVAGGLVGVAEVAECLCLLVVIPDLVEQPGGPLVAVAGAGVPAEVVVRVAEAVPGVGLPPRCPIRRNSSSACSQQLRAC